MQATSIETKLGQDYASVIEHAGWAQVDMGLVRVEGPDRIHWLHKIITADVEHLGVGEGTRAALLDHKGHFAAEFVILVDRDSVLLLTDSSTAVPVFEGLRRYVIREKVFLNEESGKWRSVTLVGKESDALCERLFGRSSPASFYHFATVGIGAGESRLIRGHRSLLPSTDVLLPEDSRSRLVEMLNSVPNLDTDILEILRVEAGLARWGVDFDHSNLALEIPDVHSIRVDQGCYVGQEVVARLVHRGHVNRLLVGLRIRSGDKPSRGEEIRNGETLSGRVTSVAESPRFGVICLGYVRREDSEIGTELQIEKNGSARVAKLPFEE